jgi:hypothetical protein
MALRHLRPGRIGSAQAAERFFVFGILSGALFGCFRHQGLFHALHFKFDLQHLNPCGQFRFFAFDFNWDFPFGFKFRVICGIDWGKRI